MTEQPDWTRPANGAGRTPNDRCIVSVGLGSHYRAMLRSTVNHCAVHCPNDWRLWYDALPEDSPSHREHQYAFKIAAWRRVIAAGFRYILWMDTAFAPVAPLDPLWERIERDGWCAPRQADSVLGTWASDRALTLYGIDRDEAMKIPLVYGGIVGLDMHSAVGKLIWQAWSELCDKGAFDGPHTNVMGLHEWEEHGYKWRGHCSDDWRCDGHRHDEAALSAVLHKLGLTPETTGLLTLENPQGIIGHHVPDFDVVKLREAALEWAAHVVRYEGGDVRAKELKELCR